MENDWSGVEVARSRSSRGEVVLRRRPGPEGPPGTGAPGSALELRANGVFVMDTVETSSEVAMAAEALALVPSPRRVLVGGLGLGFTLRRVLADPRVAEVVVVEIEEALVGWLRDGTVPHGPALLADPRVRVVVADLADALPGPGAAVDLLLLDVDNGPGYLVHDANAALYQEEFLGRCRAALSGQGLLVVWAANRAPALLADLRRVFGHAEERACPVSLQGREEDYYLYVAGTVRS